MLQHPFYWFCQHGLKTARNMPKKAPVRPVQPAETAQQPMLPPVIEAQTTTCACTCAQA